MKKLIFFFTAIILFSCSKSDEDIAKNYLSKDIIYDKVEAKPLSGDSLIYLCVITDNNKVREYLDRIQIDAESILGISEEDRKLYEPYSKMATKISNHKEPNRNAVKDYTLFLFYNGRDLVEMIPVKDHKVDELMIDYIENGYYHTKMGL